MASAISLPRTSPEAEGIPSPAVLDFIHALEQHDHPLRAVQGFMLLRHGNVAAEGWWEPYGPSHPHSLFSLSKSFTSTAIGLAVNEGRLSVEDTVLSFFPDDAPANPDANLRAMRVRHLLSMNTGHEEDTTGRVWRGDDDNWIRAFLSLPVEREPGTWFVYNTAATYMLSAIVTKLTGESLIDYLRPRLFEPLGIEHPRWDTDPGGIVNIGGSGLHIRTEDIARFGQLYLQRGEWNGQQLVPEAWIAEATRCHSDNSNTQTNPDWTVGYGYQFWRCQHDAYRGDGAFGQFCLVMPEQDAVLAINSGLLDMQAVLDAVWTHLLPAMGTTDALPANADVALSGKLASLSLPVAEGKATSPRAEQWSGKPFELEDNDLKLERVGITFERDRATLTLRDGRGDHRVQIGSGSWLAGTTTLHDEGEQPVAASGAWISDDVFEARVCYLERELCPVLRIHFPENGPRLEIEPNVRWDGEDVTIVAGRALS